MRPDDLIALTSQDEAVQVRQLGAKNRILLLEGCFDQSELAWCVEHNVDFVLHSMYQVDFLREFLQVTEGRFGRCGVWFKVDTGMHRLGFSCEEFSSAFEAVFQMEGVGIAGVMTHMACADVPESPATLTQYAQFETLIQSYPAIQRVSTANSAVLMNFPSLRSDISRPGIMLYGGSCRENFTGAQLGLKPVMRLKSKIIALRVLKAGESIGYGFRWEATATTLIGIVAAGYADGYPRHAPNGTPVWVSGRRARLAGRVSMDMIAIDLTGCDAELGTEVELWGEHISIDEVATLSGTISYEIMTGITSRVARLFLAA